MTAIAQQPSGARRGRRIIERPRLIKLLDEAEQQTILLLAPAGYGKTTLARQWAKTLNRAIWITLTPAHRDVVTLAEDLARGIDSLGGHASGFIREYLRGQTNPQRSARGVGRTLAEEANRARVGWLILDDYHQLTAESDSEEVIRALRGSPALRLLVATRTRPSWASSRGVVYGEEFEIDKGMLAMTPSESRALLGETGLDRIVKQAQGWPAVLSLAGAARDRVTSRPKMLPAKLYSYLAEELFNSAEPMLQERLFALALLPSLTPSSLRTAFGRDAGEIVARARDLGFLNDEDPVELHPLLREFLLSKLVESEDGRDQALEAIHACIDCAEWDQAVDLARQFELAGVLPTVLKAAYKPLVQSGRVATLSRLGETLRAATGSNEPEVDLVEAEVALRDGEYRLAAQIVGRVKMRLTAEHPLRARSAAIQGAAAFQLADYYLSESAFDEALSEAADEMDVAEAQHGLVLAAVYGETESADRRVADVAARAERTGAPIDVARHAACALARMRIGNGFDDSPYLEDALRVLAHVEDPRARTSVMVTLSYCLGLQAEYQRACEIAARMMEEVDAYGLEFARPHGDWNVAFAALGLRRFGEADRALQRIEDALAHRHLAHHLLNVRVLRARLLMQSARAEEAYELVRYPVNDAAAPSMHAEYVAVRAVALALLKKSRAAAEAAALAKAMSISSEVAVLAEGARAIIAAERDDAVDAARLIEIARATRVWDPVVSCVRSSSTLAACLAGCVEYRNDLEQLYNRSNDYALARRAGFRSRNVKTPSAVLSPREFEVLGLMAQGYRNRDIAAAFVISQSTVKVHVRHILEKLGVRTRTQAVARFQALEA